MIDLSQAIQDSRKCKQSAISALLCASLTASLHLSKPIVAFSSAALSYSSICPESELTDIKIVLLLNPNGGLRYLLSITASSANKRSLPTATGLTSPDSDFLFFLDLTLFVSLTKLSSILS